ncbi:hypothetical protein M0R45_026662 [Rubus argutus]|uniref:NAC domain-containing protein n=1 Tax=Rubus argutus TaxID=59490 RepID=A0AAW1WZY8_RUBAR
MQQQQYNEMEESRGNQLPGERFCPMEDELVLLYLKPMLNGQKVPGRGRVVFDCDLYGHQEPWEIWETYKTRRPNDLRLNKDLYFFTQHKKMGLTDSRIRRTVGSGTWRADDSGKIVNSVETGLVVGLKKRYSYKNEASVHHGENSNTEQEELLEPQAKRQRTVQPIDNAPVVPIPSENENDAFAAELEESLPCFEDDNVPSDAETIGFQGEDNGGLDQLASEVQSGHEENWGPSFGVDHGILNPLPENENDVFAAELEDLMLCFEDDNVPSEAEPNGFQGEQNGGLQQLAAEVQSGLEENWPGPSFGDDHGLLNPLPQNENDVFAAELEGLLQCFEADNVASEAELNGFQGEKNGVQQQLVAAMQSCLEENWPGLSFGDDLGILNPLPEEDFLWEEMVKEMGIVQMEELVLKGVSRNIDVAEESVSNNTLLPFSTQF